jgi:hypothetical protein
MKSVIRISKSTSLPEWMVKVIGKRASKNKRSFNKEVESLLEEVISKGQARELRAAIEENRSEPATAVLRE